MKAIATMTKSEIQASLLFAGKQDVRYYLNAVYFEREGEKVFIVSTNGHALLVRQVDAAEWSGSIIVPREALERAAKLLGKKDSATVCADDAGNITIRTPGGDITDKGVDAKYVPWRKVLPTSTEPGELAQYDADILADFAKASILLGGKGYPGIAHNGRGAAWATLGVENAVGVIMPCLIPVCVPEFVVSINREPAQGAQCA